jgi:hypothetical protein
MLDTTGTTSIVLNTTGKINIMERNISISTTTNTTPAMLQAAIKYNLLFNN